MIEAIDLWRTILAFATSVGAGYLAFTYRGMKRIGNPEAVNYGFFSFLNGICGFTLFLEVLARL